MESLTITVPDSALKGYVDSLVAQGEFHSAAEYVEALIAEDRKRRSQKSLEALLLEGLDGEEIELTPEVWDEMRRKYDERHSSDRPGT